MVKRILAVGAGATMLGATVMGAMAADLNDYPNMFVSDGVFNGLLVVGANAAAVDNLAMTDIAASMKYAGGAATSSVAVSGDAWLAKSGTDELEFGEAIGPATHGVVDFIDGDDLAALADGTFTSSKGSFNYEQFLHFDVPVLNTTYTQDDDDVASQFLKVPDNYQFARYVMSFLTAAKSDSDASESFKLDDFEDKQMTMLGKTYNIVKARGNAAEKVTLTLMAGSEKDSLLEGESKSYTIEGKEYDVNLLFTDSSNRAKFTVNGETTPLMDEGDTETLSDGTVLGLSEVLYQDYAGGVHQAQFFLGADKLELEDDNITLATSTDELKVNDETIDGADVKITGNILTFATTTVDGELEIDNIQVNLTAQDDYFIAPGETLLGQPELEEKDLVFTKNWDFRYEGLDPSVATDLITVKTKSGGSEYWMTFTNVQGNVIEFPLAWATGSSLRLGSQNDLLTLNKTSIGDENYFILNDDTDEDSVTQVIQYKGADDQGTSEPKMKFKVLSSGETVERPITFAAGALGATATLKIGGTTYTIANSTIGGASATDDWNITVTTGAAATYAHPAPSVDVLGDQDYLITRGGGKVNIVDQWFNSSAEHLRFNISVLDADMVDDFVAVNYLVKSFNITASSNDVDLGQEGGVTLTAPDDDQDNKYGVAATGATIKLYSPSGSGTTSDELTIDWPKSLRSPMVYVTSGAVSSSSKSGGDMKAVTFVDATKLDSEVADAKAQNLVVVGGPCVNTVAAELLGNPADCTEGFTPGKARVKLFEHANGNVAMLVAGYSGADTRLAGKVVANRASELSGKELVVEGTTYADAKLSKPSAAPQQ